MTGHEGDRRRVRIRVLVIAAVLLVSVVATWLLVPGGALRGDTVQDAAVRRAPATTTPVVRQTLTEQTTLKGELGYGTPLAINSQATGMLTWLPKVGDVIARGETLLRADEQPMVLLYGPLPMYRPLTLGLKGADVRQFEKNLRALGYTGFTVDEEFTTFTQAAVKRWQETLGVAQTGGVDATRVTYTDRAIKIARLDVRVGALAGGEVLSYTDTVRAVTVNVPAGDSAWAVKGTRVTVRLPGDRRVTGEITVVSTEASGSGDGGSGGESGNDAGSADSTIPVTVAIADQKGLGTLEKSPVEVSYTARQRENVLTVPVTALLALAEGGYGLEVVEGDVTRIVAVRTGLVAQGRVEVNGDGLAEGMIVGLAA